MFLLIMKAQLDGLVTVGLLSLALQHAIRPGKHDRHWSDYALRVIDTRLAQFFSEKSYWHNVLNFNGDVDTGWQVELLELVDRLGRGFDDVDQSLVRALLESFLRLFVSVR